MINVFEPQINFKEKLAVLKALNNKNISGSSSEIEKFENSLSKFFDRTYVASVSNGSTALEVALQSLNLNSDDEVIIPSFTIISCLSAVVRAGGKPIFCDVNKLSWNMTLDDVKKVKTSKTKAIVMVHTYGLVADAVNIEKYCYENNILLIEDSAEAHGQIINGKKCGSFGLISTLSFYANKHITSGEGGAVLTDNKEIFQKIKQIRNLDFNSSKRFKHENLYWNYRLSGLQAAFGNSSIKNIDKVINTKIKKAEVYNELFSKYEEIIQVPLVKLNDVQNHYWVYGIIPKINVDRNEIISSLFDLGIETRPFFYPLNKQPAYIKSNKEITSCPVSEEIGEKGFYIPIGNHVKEKQQKLIVEKIVNLVSN